MEHPPAPTRKRFLPWKLLYTESPSSSAQTANHYVRHSHHATSEPAPFVNAYHPFYHPSWYNGCDNTLAPLAMSLQTEQRRKQPQSNQTPFTPYHFYAPFRSSMICFTTILLPGRHKQNLPISQHFDLPTANTKPQRWCIGCSTMFRIDPEIDPTSPPCKPAEYTLQNWLSELCLGTTKGY